MKFLSTGLTRTDVPNFSTGECAMKMKIVQTRLDRPSLLFLVQFTAQAGSYGPGGQSIEQSPTQTVIQSPQELQQLVAPIALYPDALVAQVLAASTYPTEIVEAERWMQVIPT